MTAKVITVDGPSGVGKGTISELIAKTYGFHLLDSGALYRITAFATLSNSLDLNDETQVLQAIENADIQFIPPTVLLNGNDISQQIRQEAVSTGASVVAQYVSIRKRLNEIMLAFKKSPGLVADGRDMGTVVFPNADIKLFLTASSKIRAERRFKQLSEKEKNVTFSDVLNALNARDKRDSTRQVAPLKPASDAVVIDTSELDVSQVFEMVKKAVAKVGIVP